MAKRDRNRPSRIDAKFKQQLRKNLSQTINRYCLELGEKKCLEASSMLIGEMKQNLDKATPAPESAGLISSIKSSFYVKPVKRKIDNETVKGWNVHIPIDRNGLVMYLEYGTGFTGENFKHPTKDLRSVNTELFPSGLRKKQFVSWEYHINYGKSRDVLVRDSKSNTSSIKNVPYYSDPFKTGMEGFIFRKDPTSYIDIHDIQFKNEYTTSYSWVKKYKIEKGERAGTWVGPYVRYRKGKRTYTSKSTYVFSHGLRSIHFIYDAKYTVFDKLKKNEI